MSIADTKERITITLGKDLVSWCRKEAELLGGTVSIVVAMALKQYMELGGLDSFTVAVNEMKKRELENKERY